ncbi:MAG: MBL fold metallo-hydrolase [Longimicrobiales bacterium]
MKAGSLDIQTFVAAGFGENAYLVRCGEATAFAIDPGGDAGAMADTVEQDGLRLDAILLTHAHLDHVEGVASLARRTGAPAYLHPADLPLYHGVAKQAAMFGLQTETPPPIDHELADGQELRFGDCALVVRHVPGHSPGHVLFYCAEAAAAFIGDVVFMGSIGRTDLPGGDFQQLMRSIREQVLTLPPETTLLTGHGPATSVAHEARSNPFLVPQFGSGGFA